MNYLSDENIDFIANEISNSKIISTELKEDLTDHFCCLIEDEMKRGSDFNEAYDKAYRYISPDGFDEIQQETVFLLTKKKIKAMKKTIYLSSFITVFGFSAGTLFKIMHWPFAGIIILLSSMVLILALLPSLFIHQYKKEVSKVFTNKLSYVLGYSGLAMLLASMLFKIFHWPMSNILLIVSVLILNFGFFPLLFLKMYKKSTT
jgi:hypothetical protein